VREPSFGKGRKNNDFGLGFYCTENPELAKEWAVSSSEDGFCNRYSIDVSNMRVLNLNGPDFTILNWIAVLVKHRLFSLSNPVAQRAKAYLIEHFDINVNAYDVIAGYRADDSYFDFADAFLNNSITVEQLAAAMRLGKLGEQVVVKSEYAFSRIRFEGSEAVSRLEFYAKRKARNDEANARYFEILGEEKDGLFIQDIIRGGIGNDDPRIPRNPPK
jgi:hypothetical protein